MFFENLPPRTELRTVAFLYYTRTYRAQIVGYVKYWEIEKFKLPEVTPIAIVWKLKIPCYFAPVFGSIRVQMLSMELKCPTLTQCSYALETTPLCTQQWTWAGTFPAGFIAATVRTTRHSFSLSFAENDDEAGACISVGELSLYTHYNHL